MARVIHNAWEAASEWWCQAMHAEAYWPMHGRYECPRCHRMYPVPWEMSGNAAAVRADG